MSEKVSLTDPEMNRLLPGYSITRAWTKLPNGTFLGSNQPDNQINKHYWENAIMVQKYLDRMGETLFKKCLESDELFFGLLSKLHKIQVKGIRGNQEQELYFGNSSSPEHPLRLTKKEWITELRSPEFAVRVGILPRPTSELLKVIRELDPDVFDLNYLEHEVFITLPGKDNVQVACDVFIPESLVSDIHFDRTKTILGTICEMLGYGVYQERSGLHPYLCSP